MIVSMFYAVMNNWTNLACWPYYRYKWSFF